MKHHFDTTQNDTRKIGNKNNVKCRTVKFCCMLFFDVWQNKSRNLLKNDELWSEPEIPKDAF